MRTINWREASEGDTCFKSVIKRLDVKTYKAADKAGDKEDDGGCEEDAVGDDKLVEKGGVSLGSEQANSCELVALNLVGTWSPLLSYSFILFIASEQIKSCIPDA